MTTEQTQSTGSATTQSSQGAADQSASSGASSATGGSSQESTATTQTGQTQQTTAPTKPDWLPESFFDKTAGPKWDDFGKHFAEVVTRDAAEQSRRLALPQKPEDVKLELPKDFTLPQGVEFKLDPTKPEYSRLQAAAVKHGLSPEAISDIVGIGAEMAVGSQTILNTARAAEVEKLGANGTARITALQTFFSGMLGESDGKQIAGMLVTAGIVQAAEKLAAKFASQGAASFSQAHRDASGGARVDPATYDKMSYTEKKDYAAKFGAAAN